MVDALEPRRLLTVTFSGPTAFAGVDSVSSIASGDFNDDGKTDVVVAGLSPSAAVPVLGVYLSGGSSFGTPTLFPFSGTAGGVTVGKFNSGSTEDIAVVDSSTNTLDVFLGDGAGNFTPGAGASLGGTAGDSVVANGDFLGNGADGVAVVDHADNEIQIATSNDDSSGDFTVQTPISVPSPIDVVVADFNGDGKADVAALSSNGSVYVALGNGNGSFSSPVAYSAFSSSTVPLHLAAADLNGSEADLVVLGSQTGLNTGAVAVLLNSGTGTFGAASVVATRLQAQPASLVTGAFAQTGHTDIGVINTAGGMAILLGNGDGTFGAGVAVYTSQLATVGAFATTGDFNGDGKTDIAFSSGRRGTFKSVLNTTVATESISGAVYVDSNGDGVRQRREANLAGIPITLQLLRHGRASGRAITVTSNKLGLYSFNLALPGFYEVTETRPRGYRLTQPSTGSYILDVTSGEDLTLINFGNEP